jgi:hypothetical protein
MLWTWLLLAYHSCVAEFMQYWYAWMGTQVDEVFLFHNTRDLFLDIGVSPSAWAKRLSDEDPADWDDARMEVRYRYRGHKYRAVVPVDLTSRGLVMPDLPGTRTTPARRVFKAILVRSEEGTRCDKVLTSFARGAVTGTRCDKSAVSSFARGTLVNVTRRVNKYQGPYHDFHGQRIRVDTMFPFEGPPGKLYLLLPIVDVIAVSPTDYLVWQDGNLCVHPA